MTPAGRLARELVVEVRRVPLRFYIVLFFVGIVLIARFGYQQLVRSQAAREHARVTESVLRQPIEGMLYQITIHDWSPSMRLLPFNGPLTSHDSYSFELIPAGSSDCRATSIQQIAVEFRSPAFDIGSPARESRPLQQLQQGYCSPGPVAAPYHWDGLAKQEGQHVVSFQIMGIDARGNPVFVRTIEEGIIVSDDPFTFTAVIGILTGIAGAIGASVTVADWLGRGRAS